MHAEGEPVRAYKPALTGLEEPAGEWPRDHELLGSLCGVSPDDVAPLRFAAPASPHLAAELEGARIEPAQLVATARDAGRDRTVVVEGVGGLLVPFAESFCVRDLAGELALPVVVVARPGLGTINHTLLTLEAARAAGLDVAAVVLNQWPARPGAIEHSNRQTIERLGSIPVCCLGHVQRPESALLAAAGATLPWRQWLRGA